MVSNEMAFNLLCGEILPSSAQTVLRLSWVILYRKYNLIVCQEWIDQKHLGLLCDKFYMQSTIAGYVQSSIITNFTRTI